MREGSSVSALLLGTVLTLLFTWFSVFFGLHGAAGGVRRILCYVRVPRTFGVLLSGIAFGASGYPMQEALYSTLVPPSVMGVNADMGLFALLAALLSPAVTAARFVLTFLGALFSILLVLLIMRRAGYNRSVVMLSDVAMSALIGAAVNSFVTFFPYTVADRQIFTLGGFAGLRYDGLFFSTIFILPRLLVGALFGGGIDLFALGDEVARGLGLSMAEHRLLTMAIAAVPAAATVRIGGLIEFLGPIVSSVLRRFSAGWMSVRQMFTLSRLYSGAPLIATDFLTRRLFCSYELLVGLLLGLPGAPFFIWMLMCGKRGIQLKSES